MPPEDPLDALLRSQGELAPRVVVPAAGPPPTERVPGLDVQYEGAFKLLHACLADFNGATWYVFLAVWWIPVTVGWAAIGFL